MDEMRRFKRVNVSFSVLYTVDAPLTVRMQVGSKEFDAEALDLSEEGMAILTKSKQYAIPAFTKVTVKFTMLNRSAIDEDRYRSIEIKGEVLSSFFMKEKGVYRFGIHFIDISDHERAFINDFVGRK